MKAKEIGKETSEVVRILTMDFGRFLLLSLKEPVEYALDQYSKRGYKKNWKSLALAVPAVSIGIGATFGLASESTIIGTCATGVTWWISGAVQRGIYIQDYGQS